MAIDSPERFAAGDHLVHFFDTDESLVGVVAGYLSSAVLGGDAAVIVVAPGHRELFQAALAAAGVDVGAAMADGRLVVRDAADTMAAFVADGRVDARVFDEVVGGLIRDAYASGRPVRAYGEMVALLWAAGDVTAAMDLEGLWNRLGETVPFSLFCAYPQRLFADSPKAGAFAQVCRLHSGVVGAAPTSADAEVTRRFARTPHAPKHARWFVSETLNSWDRSDLRDDVALVVAELATNAVVHGRSDVAVGLLRRDGGVRIIVGDTSAAPPVPRGGDATAFDGRGLAMISAIGRAWGHQVVEGGKLIWVDVATVSEIRAASPWA